MFLIYFYFDSNTVRSRTVVTQNQVCQCVSGNVVLPPLHSAPYASHPLPNDPQPSPHNRYCL